MLFGPSLPSSSSAWVLLRARNKVPELAEQMYRDGLSRTHGSKKTLPYCCPWTGWSIRGHPSWTQTQSLPAKCKSCLPRDTTALTTPGTVFVRTDGWNSVEDAGAKSGVGKAHRFILIWTNWEVSYLHDAEWLLTEPDHGLNTTGMVGEGREASPCGPESWEHRNILCSAVSVRVNHWQSFHLESWHTVCEGHDTPGGGREAKGQHWWKVQRVNAQPRPGDWRSPVGNESHESHTEQGTPSPCPQCASGCDSKSPGTWPGQPLSLSFHSHTSLKGKKPKQ